MDGRLLWGCSVDVQLLILVEHAVGGAYTIVGVAIAEFLRSKFFVLVKMWDVSFVQSATHAKDGSQSNA